MKPLSHYVFSVVFAIAAIILLRASYIPDWSCGSNPFTGYSSCGYWIDFHPFSIGLLLAFIAAGQIALGINMRRMEMRLMTVRQKTHRKLSALTVIIGLFLTSVGFLGLYVFGAGCPNNAACSAFDMFLSSGLYDVSFYVGLAVIGIGVGLYLAFNLTSKESIPLPSQMAVKQNVQT